MSEPDSKTEITQPPEDPLSPEQKEEVSIQIQHKLIEKLHQENEKLRALTEELTSKAKALEEEMERSQNLERQLAQAQKLEALGQMATGIAHEINSPAQFIGDSLAFIKSAFDEILEGAAKDDVPEFLRDNLPQAMANAQQGVERLAEIVSSMKRFSHSGDGRKKQPGDVNQAVGDSMAVSKNLWKYHLEIDTELDEELPEIPCFVSEISQVILNLIVNATHAIIDAKKAEEGREGRIIIRTKQVEDGVTIEIRDNANGIPEEIREQIFDPYFTTKKIGEGTGQGLALAQSQIVKTHGGRIHFETELGIGTAFFIFLPLDPEKPAGPSG
tara:strand:- start:4291 stop:5277 length:987 start_codon:yes stop_codon:yes gene_type:complete